MSDSGSPENSLPFNSERTHNRLIHEKSPYLLQHAKNPVDWFPWGEEAFKKARTENKPVFLSIGYSTCHWCHVMERESFENPEVAALMNRVFVSVKVDREERPDIDSVYMSFCQALTGSGGWPLTIIMTPEKKPFFAGTYFPKESRQGRMGMLELIRRIEETWWTRQDDVLRSAEQIAFSFQQIMAPSSSREELGESVLDEAYEQLLLHYDSQHGGFGSAPKFPAAQNLLFLLRYWKRTGLEQALALVEQTLHAMRKGGIYDHIGFGFHRYSTDSEWRVPHFEKMLYDQAMLAIAYCEAFQATRNELFSRTARETFDYVLRDMVGPHGGFYSAQDADVDGEEGGFYLWTADEIRGLLSPADAELVEAIFNVEEEGNFVDQTTGEHTGTNVLYSALSAAEAAALQNMTEDEVSERLERIRSTLFTHRNTRTHALTDDKVLTDWNGLMIAALAKGYQVLGERKLLRAAEKAKAFVVDTLSTPEGRLLHRYREGEAALPGYLDDYCFFIWGLIELYEASFKPSYLAQALELSQVLFCDFWDDVGKGFFFSPHDAEALVVRRKDVHEGAIPSGNSVALVNLVRLAWLTGKTDLEEKAMGLAGAFAAPWKHPSAHTHFMTGLDAVLGPSQQVVIVGEAEACDTQEMIAALRGRFLPNAVVLLSPTAGKDENIEKLSTIAASKASIEGKATAYVCSGSACREPTTDSGKMLELVSEK